MQTTRTAEYDGEPINFSVDNTWADEGRSGLAGPATVSASLNICASVLAVAFAHAGETISSDSADSEYWLILGHKLKITDFLLVAFNGLLFLATVGLFLATIASGARRVIL